MFKRSCLVSCAAALGCMALTPLAAAGDAAKVVYQPPPQYPASAMRQGQEGWVEMALTLDPKGKVRDVRVVDSEPQEVFDHAAVRAARQWRFDPRSLPSEGDQVEQVVRVDFSL